MSICTRWGVELRAVRRAAPSDLDGIAPEETEWYVIGTRLDGSERVYHRSELRADEGSIEIERALDLAAVAS